MYWNYKSGRLKNSQITFRIRYQEIESHDNNHAVFVWIVSPDKGCILVSGLENQAEIYEDASSTASSLSVFIFSLPFYRLNSTTGGREGQEPETKEAPARPGV